jgi:hypothetical protein
MIRNFFVDCVIVVALCLVVWGVTPATLVAQDDDQDNDIDTYTLAEIQAMGINTNPTNKNRCCKASPQKAQCGEDNQHGVNKMCKQRGVDCSFTTLYLNFWVVKTKCVCTDWAFMRPGGRYAIEGCACS